MEPPNVGGSDSGVGDGRNELNERQLSEKLEKSEAGRKKLRQAIGLLKEKLDATSQALEVNEALRQEVEKERLNVDTERKRAEEEKALREKLEEENVSIKEQFVGVLQRLDSLESSYKAEFGRIRSEVKEGIGAALQAVEATQGLYQSLERSLHAKVNGAVQSSSKALAMAQSGQAATSRAQAAALAAQSLAKAMQKEVLVVSSQVVTLQKQASNLSAMEASLQQEPQLKGPCTPLNSPDAGESNVSLAVPKEKVSIDAACPNQGTVLSKTTQKSNDEGDMLNMLVASTDKSRSNPMCCSSNGLPPRGGMFLSRNQILDGGLKSQSTIPPVRKSPRKGSVEMVSRDESTPSQPGSVPLRKGPVAIITGLDSILSPAVRVPETATKSAPSLYITSPSARATALPKQSEVQPQKFGDASRGPGSRECSNKRPAVKRGQGDSNVARSNVQQSKSSTDMAGKQITSTAGLPARTVACSTVEDDGDTFLEGMPQLHGKPYPSSTTKLLKSVMKMFEKEGRNRKSMEDKLMKLQAALESPCDSRQVAQVGTKRKRETRKEKGDGALEEKGKKRHRQGKESKKQAANFFSLDDAVTSPTCPTEDKHLLQEKEVQQTDVQASEDGEPAQDRLSEMISSLQDRCRGEGMFESAVDCQAAPYIRISDMSIDLLVSRKTSVTHTVMISDFHFHKMSYPSSMWFTGRALEDGSYGHGSYGLCSNGNSQFHCARPLVVGVISFRY